MKILDLITDNELATAWKAAPNEREKNRIIYSLPPADLAKLREAVCARYDAMYRAAEPTLTTHADDPAYAPMRRKVDGLSNFRQTCQGLQYADKEAVADGLNIELETSDARFQRRMQNMLREHRRSGAHGKSDTCPSCEWAVELLAA